MTLQLHCFDNVTVYVTFTLRLITGSQISTVLTEGKVALKS